MSKQKSIGPNRLREAVEAAGLPDPAATAARIWTALEGLTDARQRKAAAMIGQTFGRLTVLSRAASAPGAPGRYGAKARFLCRCTCGTQCFAIGSHLRCGKRVSCGCQRVDKRGRFAGRFTLDDRALEAADGADLAHNRGADE